MVPTDHRKPAWTFYPGWVVTSAISIPIAWFFSWTIVSQIGRVLGDTIHVAGRTRITQDFILVYVLLPVLGLSIGALQYLLLRRHFPRMGWWIAATLLGWALPLLLLRLVDESAFPALNIGPALAEAFALAFAGASVGLIQWLVLRRRIPRAAIWILASILGWGFAGLIAGQNMSSVLGIMGLALLPPIVASIAWWWLLGNQPSRTDSGGGIPSPSLLAG